MTTKKTTKTTTLADIAQQSRDALTEASETLQERRTALVAVQEEVEAVKRSWAAGDDSVPASRLTELEHEEVRLTALTNAAERRHRAALSSLKTDDPALAEVVAHAIGTSIYGVQAQAVTSTPKAVGDDLPHVWVVQSKPHTENVQHGTLAGDVTLRLERPRWAKPLDQVAFRQALKKAGVELAPGAVMSGDTLRLKVLAAHPEVPAIAGIEEGMDASAAGVSVTSRVDPIYQDHYSGTLATVLDSSGCVTGVKVDDHGKRTATVETTLTLRPNPRGGWDATTAVEQTKKELNHLVGQVLTKCGRITNVEHVGVSLVEYEHGGKGRKITTRFTTVSQVA